MKKILSILHILSIVSTILLLASCSQEELGTPFYAWQEVSISAAFSSDNPANNGKKRISGKDNVDRIDLTWDEGDKILVTVGDKSAVFTLTSGAGTNNATFMGKMPADGSNFHVSYPIDYTDEVLTNQTYVANGFGKGLMKMSTKIPGTLDDGFMLSADNSLLGLELHGTANVSKIVLTNNDNQKAYTLDCSTQTVNTAEGTLFYIIVPAGTWSKGLTIEVFNSNGALIEKREKTTEAAFAAGQALMMPQVEISEPTCGKRIGIFTVSDDKKVSFSQGNLQYTQSTNTWHFAKNQWEYIGADNVKNGVLADKIDLFGWSGKDSNAPWGISTSTSNADYAGEFVDWGVNEIQGDAANTWRTLSIEEWDYLIHTRPNAAALCGVASVNGVHGLIIFPDEWVCPEGVVFKSGFHANYSVEAFAEYQIINADQWVVLEESGAVFLSAAGWRKGKVIDSIQRGVHYWSSTIGDEDDAHYLSCSSQQAWSNRNTRDRAFAVRLVHDTIRTYCYGITEEQFAEAKSEWKLPGMGWAIKDQTPIQGKVLHGIRIKVASPGSFNLYKASSPMEKSEANLQRVSTITTTVVGLQDIDFTEPFYLSKNEYLVVGCPSDASSTTLKGNHTSTNTTIQPFYRLVGSASVASATISSLMLDFY